MAEYYFSMFLASFAMLVMALYYLFFKKLKEEGKQNAGKPLFYFLLLVSAIFVAWSIIAIILDLVNGNEICIRGPHSLLFIMSIFMVVLGLYDLFVRKKKWPQYSWFSSYFLLVYSSLIVVWGIVSFIIY